MLWMQLVEWPDHLLRTDRRVEQGPPNGYLAHEYVYASARCRGGFRGVPAGGWGGEVSERQYVAGVHDSGGERRLLFGAGEGPTEAVVEAQCGSSDACLSRIYESRRVGPKWVSRHIVATYQ